VLNSMFPSPELTALEQQQGQLYAQYAALSTKFGPNYPPLVELKQQMAKIDQKVAGHTADVRGRLKHDYDSAVQTESLLQQQYEALTNKAYAENRQQAQLAVLRAELNSSRELYNTLQYKLQQAGVDAGLTAVSTMVLDTARQPMIPVEPKKSILLGGALFLGLVIGVALAIVMESVADLVHNADELERVVGLPLLAAVPHFKIAPGQVEAERNAEGKPVPSSLRAELEPRSRESEAFRSLRSAVMLSSIDAPPKVLLITSALPGEGKSTTAANIAVVLAQTGSRVLLVDGDLRRPSLHMRFGMSQPTVGTGEFLLGERPASPYSTPLPNLPELQVLFGGKPIPFPAELLSSNKFRDQLERWRAEFDYLVFDSAPLLIVSDSQPLSTWVDGMVLVTRHEFTPLKALRRLRNTLNRSHARLIGVVLNDLSSDSTEYGAYKYGYDYYTQK